MVPTPEIARPAPEKLRDGYLGEVAVGLRFLRDDHLLLALALILMAGNAVGGPVFAVFLPVYAEKTTGQATTVGLAVAAVGVGGLIGALGFGAVGHRWSRRWTWLAGCLIGPLPVWALAAAPPLPLPLVIAALALGGLAMGSINPLLVTVRHERIPVALRARVFATFSALAMVAQPLAMVLGGWLVEEVGFHLGLLVAAAASQVVGLVALSLPVLRRLDREPGQRPAVAQDAGIGQTLG